MHINQPKNRTVSVVLKVPGYHYTQWYVPPCYLPGGILTLFVSISLSDIPICIFKTYVHSI